MSDRTSLGDRMKRYEASYRYLMPRRTYSIIRVDGRAFHTLLRRAEKPYDGLLIRLMDTVGIELCREISGAVFAYVQSDEINVLFTDFAKTTTEPWFGGVMAKQISIAASTATAVFNTHTASHPGFPASGYAQFDARVFTINDPVEVANYFIWRQRDAIRNSISMLAQSKFSHKQLHGKNTDQMQEMLFQEHQINWNDYPPGIKRGRVITRDAIDGWDCLYDTPKFSVQPDNWLANTIPALPSLKEEKEA